MSNPDTHSGALTLKQRVFLVALFVLSLIISAIVLFCFNPAGSTSMAVPKGVVRVLSA